MENPTQKFRSLSSVLFLGFLTGMIGLLSILARSPIESQPIAQTENSTSILASAPLTVETVSDSSLWVEPIDSSGDASLH